MLVEFVTVAAPWPVLGRVVGPGGAVEVSAAFADAEEGSVVSDAGHMLAWGAGSLFTQINPAQVHSVEILSAKLGVLHVPLVADM